MNRHLPARGRLAFSAVAIALTVAAIAVGMMMPASAPAGGGGRARIALGAYIPHADDNPSLIDAFRGEAGWSPVIINSFKTFDQAPIYFPQLNGIRNHGAVPMVSWEPQTSSGGSISLARIASGAYDGYLQNAAQAAAAWGNPLMVRFGEEMNGGWYAWSPAQGNPARAFVAAWRHIVTVFRQEGADNVKWVWTPYVNPNGDLPFARFYPGDRYVDWAGLDGYNWGGAFRWESFRELFAESYHQLVRMTSRPLIIGEVGCGEIGGSKARWIRLMFNRNLPRMGHFRAVVWFDDVDEKGDLRINTSGVALEAFRRWTNHRLYSSNLRLLLHTPPHL